MIRLAVALAFLATALVLSGCGQPRDRTHEVRLGLPLEPPGLDPTSGAAAAIREVTYANIFEGLTRIGSKGEVLPALAKSWEVSPDRLTYTFHLQANVKFHDGTPFDAGIVKFSLERTTANGSTNAQQALFEPIADVEVIDPMTVKVTLKHPVGDFLFNMGWGDAVMVAPNSAANNATNPIGTGPFKFSRWQRGVRIELVKNPDYWGTPAKLDKVSFVMVSDPAGAYAALLSGDIDSFPGFPAPELLPQLATDPRFTIAQGNTQGETILAMNLAHAPYDNLKVRQAISHAINRKDLINGVMEGYGQPIGSFFPPSDPAYIDLTGTYPYNPTAARKLMAEAGYPNGFHATLRLPPVAYARRGGEIIAQELREIGIDVTIENIEWAQWLDQVYKRGDYDLTIVAHTEPRDIGIYARDNYYLHYAKPEFKALMDRLEVLDPGPERTAILQQAQKMLADDAASGFLFELPKIGVWDARLKGQWTDAPIPANDMTAVYWEN